MSKGRRLHRTYGLLCFVFALSWVVQRDLGGFFSAVQGSMSLFSKRMRESASWCQETDLCVELNLVLAVNGWRPLSFKQSLCPSFMLRVSHPHSQGFSSACRHRNVAIFLFSFSITWPEPMYTGFIWYYFLIWYNSDLNILQFIKHCQWFSIKKRGRNFESLNTFCFPSMLHHATLSVCFCGFDSYMNRSSPI